MCTYAYPIWLPEAQAINLCETHRVDPITVVVRQKNGIACLDLAALCDAFPSWATAKPRHMHLKDVDAFFERPNLLLEWWVPHRQPVCVAGRDIARGEWLTVCKQAAMHMLAERWPKRHTKATGQQILLAPPPPPNAMPASAYTNPVHAHKASRVARREMRAQAKKAQLNSALRMRSGGSETLMAVSYTHLTLPTICSV